MGQNGQQVLKKNIEMQPWILTMSPKDILESSQY